MLSKIKNMGIMGVGLVMSLLIFTSSANAKELTGNEILEKEEANRPASEIMISEMTIVHKSGAKRIRTIKIWTKGDDYTLVRFISPANIKGTGFLSVKDDDWLYLPALRKVRRIAGKDKGKSFMGSDFSYEDVGTDSLVEKYNARLLGIEKYEEQDCYILELLPKDAKGAIYSKQKRWVDKARFNQMKTEYYDEHGDLLKIMYLSEVEEIEGFWLTKKMEMQNVQKGSKTIIVEKEVKVNPAIPDKMFTTRQLEKR
ncbi:outer membrane lipoprotein-sorting protein [bacterium]|nr:outer membrane lipoprotein-sorting protein [bacterium]